MHKHEVLEILERHEKPRMVPEDTARTYCARARELVRKECGWLSSSVLNQYGRQIKATVEATLERLEVTSGHVTVVDKGALDCTLKARVECAVFRSCDISASDVPWGGVIR